MKNFLQKTCLLVLMLVMGASAAWADEYRIVFNTNTSDGSTVIASNVKVATVVSNGTQYVSGFTGNCSKAYYSSKSGVKLGSSSAAGAIEFNIAEAYQSNVSSVTVKTVVYGTDESSLTLEYNGGTKAGSTFTPGTDYQYTFNKLTTLTSLKISSTKRAYVSEVVIVTSDDEAGGGTTPTTYNVTIDKNIANGTVSASSATATAGATVTLTAIPATGYEFGSWSVTNASTSSAISVADNKFTMPAANVYVSATFNQTQTGGETGGDGTTVAFGNLGYASWGKEASFSGSTYDELSQTKSGVTFNYVRGSGSTYANTNAIRFYKDNKLTFTAPKGYVISSIVWTGSGFKNDVTTDVERCTSTTSALSWAGNATSVTFTRPSDATSYVTLSSVEVTLAADAGEGGEEGGGTTTEDSPISNFIKTSTLSLEVGAGNYDVRQCLNLPTDYPEGTAGIYNITTTINGLTQKDGEFACVYPYLAFLKAGTYTVTVKAAAVPGKYAETTGTITVTVTGGTTPEPEVTVYENLAALVADGAPTTDGSNVTVTLTNEVITGIYTTSGGYRNGIFLQVGEREIEIYCKNVPEYWEVGGTVSGTLYKCPWKLFNSTWELCPESWGLLYYTAPALQELSITGEPKNEYYVGDSFDVAGLTVTAKYASGTTLDVTDQVEWACEPETFTQEGSAIQVTVMAGLGETIAEKTYTVSVAKNPYVIAGNFTAIKGNIDENISYEAFKGNAANDPFIPKDTGYIRLYQNGGYITITGAKGVTISEVILTTGSTYETTTIGYAVGDDDVPTTGSTVAKNSDFKVSGLSCNSISFYCLGTDKNTRLDIAAIKVKYTKVDINLASISVAGEGIGKEFLQNSTFNHEGITVTARYTDQSSEDVTAKAEFTEPDMTNVGEKTVEVSYTEGGVTKTTSYTINVVAESITKLHIATLPAKTVFKLGESFSCEGLSVTADYNSGRKGVELEAADYEVVAPDVTTPGKKEVTVSLIGNEQVSTSYNVTVLPTNTIFFESFDTNDGTGGNDGKWSGSIASNTFKSDNAWTVTAAGGADQCAKFGAGSTAGSAVTPALGHVGAVTVSFKAAAWDSNNEATTITVSIDGVQASEKEITLTKSEWHDYSVTLSGLTADSKVKFSAKKPSNNRFFLDEVLITEATVSSVTNYIEALKNGEDGYTLDGLQKVVNDILQIEE